MNISKFKCREVGTSDFIILVINEKLTIITNFNHLVEDDK